MPAICISHQSCTVSREKQACKVGTSMVCIWHSPVCVGHFGESEANCCFECHHCDLILSFSLLSKYTQEVTKKKIRLNDSTFLVIYMKHIHSHRIYNLLYNFIKLQFTVCKWDLAWTLLLLVRFVERSLVLNMTSFSRHCFSEIYYIFPFNKDRTGSYRK